jgi:hypothetical protein
MCLTGQWTGGSHDHIYIVANLEQNDGLVTGRISSFQGYKSTEDLPSLKLWTWLYLEASLENENMLLGSTNEAKAYHHHNGEPYTEIELKVLQDSWRIELSTGTDLKGEIVNQDCIIIKSNTQYKNIDNTENVITLNRVKLAESTAVTESMDWNEFKKFVLAQPLGTVYRGQAKHWALQTTYHRTGHADIISYIDTKLPQLTDHINSISKIPYDLSNYASLGALLYLAQHHGYPTPLLDWTASPYVAAFFAIENESELTDEEFTIFVFDQPQWIKLTGKSANTHTPVSTLRSIELSKLGNPRALPQHSKIMYSNVKDIESVIMINEVQPGQFLKAIKLPIKDRGVILKDLRLMGINMATLFPDYDGICKEFRDLHF